MKMKKILITMITFQFFKVAAVSFSPYKKDNVGNPIGY
jgi:hypothetical protein